MKLLFVHISEKLREDKAGNLYTDGSYNIEAWNRYFSISDDLSVIFRKENKKYDVEDAKAQFNQVKKGIKFIEVIDRTVSVERYFDLKAIKLNNKIIEKAVSNCDYLIVRSPSGAGYTALKYAKKYNKPYLVEVVGCPWDSLWNHSFMGKILAVKSYLQMKKAVKDAPYAVYVTDEFLQHRYPCNGRSKGCSDVSLPPLNENILEKRLDKIENMNKNMPIVLGTTAAVNVRYKGQEYVIKAISELNKQGYNFEYHLAGGGDNSYLKSIAERYNVVDKVRFLGPLPHENIFDYLDSIDIYIQPSKTEGLPRALVEAMSRGCPSIGSNVGGIPELLNNEFIFKKKSVNQICTLLIKMNEDVMVQEASRSFEKSKEYSKVLLDERRNGFYVQFINNVKL